MTQEEKYRDAALVAEARKTQFLADMCVTKARLSPERLKANAKAGALNAVYGVGAGASDTVKRHPFATAGVAAAGLAFVLRRPLMALSRRLTVLVRSRFSNDRPEDVA